MTNKVTQFSYEMYDEKKVRNKVKYMIITFSTFQKNKIRAKTHI